MIYVWDSVELYPYYISLSSVALDELARLCTVVIRYWFINALLQFYTEELWFLFAVFCLFFLKCACIGNSLQINGNI